MTATDGPGAGARVDAAVEAVFREERGRLLAALVHRFGDLDLAEDVAGEAIEAALVHWPVRGVPVKPGAWLLTTARGVGCRWDWWGAPYWVSWRMATCWLSNSSLL